MLKRALAIAFVATALTAPPALAQGSLPTAKDIQVDLKKFDDERKELRNRIVKNSVRTYAFYNSDATEVHNAMELLTDIKAHISAVWDRSKTMTASERAEFARTYDGIGKQLQKVRKMCDKHPFVCKGPAPFAESLDPGRADNDNAKKQSKRFKELFEWFYEARQDYGKSPKAEEKKERHLLVFTDTKKIYEIVPGRWAADFAEKGKTPKEAKEKAGELDVDEGDLDERGWSTAKRQILANYRAYLEAIGCKKGKFVGYRGVDPRYSKRRGEYEQTERVEDNDLSDDSPEEPMSWWAALKEHAKAAGARVRTSAAQSTDLDALTGSADSIERQAQNAAAAGADKALVGSADTLERQAENADQPPATSDGTPTPGETYVVQAGDTLTSIAQAVLGALSIPLDINTAYGPGGLIENLARAMGIQNPNLIVTGAQLQIPPKDFFKQG